MAAAKEMSRDVAVVAVFCWKPWQPFHVKRMLKLHRRLSSVVILCLRNHMATSCRPWLRTDPDFAGVPSIFFIQLSARNSMSVLARHLRLNYQLNQCVFVKYWCSSAHNSPERARFITNVYSCQDVFGMFLSFPLTVTEQMLQSLLAEGKLKRRAVICKQTAVFPAHVISFTPSCCYHLLSDAPLFSSEILHSGVFLRILRLFQPLIPSFFQR